MFNFGWTMIGEILSKSIIFLEVYLYRNIEDLVLNIVLYDKRGWLGEVKSGGIIK